MKHMFDSETAEKYGVNAAILFANLAFWIEKNAKDGVNFRDGRYWTYCSRRMFRERFPYLTERQIGTALQKLTDAGLIITGCFNNFGRDRTLWYALSEKGQALNDRSGAETTERDGANTEAREPECQTDSAEISNGKGGNVTPTRDKAEDKTPSPLPLTAAKGRERAAKGEKYGEFVTMTREEYRSLEERYGAERTKLATEILDNYKGATGKRYKSDYRAVLSWSMERAGEKMRAGRRPREPAEDGGGFTPSDGFADWPFSPTGA